MSMQQELLKAAIRDYEQVARRVAMLEVVESYTMILGQMFNVPPGTLKLALNELRSRHPELDCSRVEGD